MVILSTFIKLPFVIKIFVMSIFEWMFYTRLLYTNSGDVHVMIDVTSEKISFDTVHSFCPFIINLTAGIVYL